MAPSGEPHEGSDLGLLLTRLQSDGLRSNGLLTETRTHGAGPSDAGMLWVEGVATTVPTHSDFVRSSPYELREEAREQLGIYLDGERIASAARSHRPRYYDLQTADGVPYWKIAVLHLDSVASTVIQTCAYWGTGDQCRFCGIEASLGLGRTIRAKRPDQLAEVATAAKDLDGAVDVTLTTGTTHGPDKGALYLGRCARSIKDASGLPVEAQFEPPEDSHVLEAVHELGVDSVGMHVESFDPNVLARVAPAKARTGIEGYFLAWERAVEVFGRGQVSTYVILGMGEDPDMTVAGCKRAIDAGVYPFVVPLRPVLGSLMHDHRPPEPVYVETIYREVGTYMAERGMSSADVRAGCARCQGCSAIATFERRLGGPDGPGRASLRHAG